MPKNLKNKTIAAAIWSMSQQFGCQGISFIIQIVLARLLLPEDFGLIAMIQIFVSVSKTLMDSGMTASLVRDKDAGEKDFSTVFYVNLFVTTFIYLTLFYFSPLIAGFFDQPLLTVIIRVYAITFFLQALVAVQVTKLTKELEFKIQMFIQIPSTLIGGIVGIILAKYDHGVWSIVWMNIVSKTIFMLLVWIKSGWYPKLLFDKTILAKHFNFGYRLLLSGLITNIYLNLYKIIVGRNFSIAQLGFYNQADMLRMFPVATLTSTLQKVTFPAFSIIQDDNERLKKAFQDTTSVVFFIICPSMIFLVIIADSLFHIILGEKWLPAVHFFQILALSSFFYPLSIYNLNIILVKGRTDLYLKMELIKKITSLLFLFLIIPFGIWGVVYAQGISMAIHYVVNAYYCGKLLDYSLKDQIMDLAPTLLINSFLAIPIYLINLNLESIIFSDLLLITSNAFVYFSFLYLLSKVLSLSALEELENQVRRLAFR